MSDHRHTAGEWRTSRDPLTGAVWAGDELIASVYPNAPEGWDGRSEFERLDETRANARLVAAAPDLLEALRELAEQVTQALDCGLLLSVDGKRPDLFSLRAAKNAISKAEGN